MMMSKILSGKGAEKANPPLYLKIFCLGKERGQNRLGSTPDRGNNMPPIYFAASWRQVFLV